MTVLFNALQYKWFSRNKLGDLVIKRINGINEEVARSNSIELMNWRLRIEGTEQKESATQRSGNHDNFSSVYHCIDECGWIIK